MNRRLDLDAVVDRFIPSGMTEFRARAWARFVIAVSFVSAPVWLIFPLLGGLTGSLPEWWAAVLVGLGMMQLGIPFVLRATRSLFLALMVFGSIVFAGITVSAHALGGFPFHALMWAMAIPVALAAQRQFRSLLPIWAVAVVMLYLGSYVLAGSTAEPSIGIWLEGASLLCWFGVMMMVSHHTSIVTYELADSRDAYQRALLQAQKLNALGKLAGSIENNFNNALMSIDYSLVLLSETLTGSDLAVELDDMQDTVVRSKALSKKLERLGQGDAETIQLVEVDVAVEALGRSLRRLTGAATLRLDLGAPKAHILCDANQLDQVLVNLVVNARDAMPQGGELAVATSVHDGQVRIEVRDSGTGIPPEVLDHIFEPFYTTKGPDSGTGLGLWICRSIATGSGGALTAASQVGRGTTMTLELPLADQHSRPTPRAQLAPRPLETARKTQARTYQLRSWSRGLAWFVRDIDDSHQRLWGMVLVTLGVASVPIWWLFAGLQWHAFGPTTVGYVMLAGGVLSLSVPVLVRISAPEPAAFALAAIHFAALTTIAIVGGGFRIEILIWATVIPILGAQQHEFRYFTRFWTVLVGAQLVVVFVLAVTGVTSLPPLSPTTFQDQRLAVLLALGALLVIGFRATSRVGAHFARQRDEYALTLVRSQDFELLGTLASSIAHDLNNILTTLEFGVDYLRSELPPEHPALGHLDELQLATAKIQDLSRQLTRFGRTTTVTTNAVPDTALASLAKLLGPIVGSHIKISMRLEAGATAIRVRSHELDQLIINLALNARDAMPDGGELEITTAEVGNMIEIAVRDRGLGIPQELLDRVCEPFFTTAEDRVGLGLWVCREIVREAHGTLAIESTVGRGTTVRIVVPRALARASDSMRRVSPRRSTSQGIEPAPASSGELPVLTSSTRIRREP